MTEATEDDPPARYRRNWQGEVDSAAQYRAMAARESDPAVAKVYRDLAAVEEKHAGFWEERLRGLGIEPGARRPGWRARVLIWVTERLGPRAVLPTVAAREYAGRDDYGTQPETARTGMQAQERSHARVLRGILTLGSGASGGAILGQTEGRHRNVGGNALRAAVLGANDGLCSNLSLVMGVAGAAQGGRMVLVTGIAGLLAGACSMALGEWVSVTSAREMARHEVDIERDELAAAPEEEREELQLIYEAKGLPASEARSVSARLMHDPATALDVLAREELGVDPESLGGSALVAAVTSFALFALGAVVPVVPFALWRGGRAMAVSIGLSSVVLFALGAAITVFTGRPVVRSGTRQLVLGLGAAGITYVVGRALGVALG